MLRYFAFFAVIAAITNGSPNDEPNSLCEDLTPQHGVIEPQPGDAPYTIFISKLEIHPGESVQVAVQGKGEELFKGVMIQARQGDTIIGNFEEPKNDPETTIMDCPPGTKNTIIYETLEDKNIVIMTWIAPTDFQGTVNFKSTIVKNFQFFWVGVTSTGLTVKQ